MEKSSTKRELFSHQISGIEFLKKAKKAILADEMGLGKSFQAIIAAGETSSKVMIVCPASLKINWQREIGMAYPNDIVRIFNSKESSQDLFQLIYAPKWYILNYDILEKNIDVIEELIQKGMDTLILDEAHYIKGKQTIRSAMIIGGKAKKKIEGEDEKVTYPGIASKMKQVFLLTGTPLMNRPIELFNLLKAIDHPLGKLRSFFARRYCDAFLKVIPTRSRGVIRYMDESGASNLGELREAIKGVMIRRKKDEVLDLPPRIMTVMDCELDREWQKTYDSAWDAYIQFLEENPIPERNIDNILQARHLVEIQKLKQVCSRAKIKRIVQDVKNAIEQDEKVIIFSQYTQTINDLSLEMMTEGIGHKTLTGADDMHKRQNAVDAFQNDPEIKVFIANIKAGGVGLNLTAASIVMFADLDWSPEIHNQAIDRAHRIGQSKAVNAYFYICNETIEEDIMDILNQKKNILNKVIEGYEDKIHIESNQRTFLKRMASKIPT